MTLNLEKQFKDNYYIDNPILAILIVLCYFTDEVVLKASDFNGNFNEIEDVYNNYLKKYGIKVDTKTKKHKPVDNLDKRKEDYLEVKFYIEDNVREKLKDYLKEYLNNYQKGEIIKQNGENLISYDSLKKKFIDSIDTTLNRVNYNVTTIGYLPVIFYENICLNTIEIKNISLIMSSEEDYISELIHEDSETYYEYLYDFLSANICLDIREFIEQNDNNSKLHKNHKNLKNQKQQVQQNNIKRREHFSPSVKDLFDYLKQNAPRKNYEIFKEDLIGDDRRNKLYCGMGELTTAVNRLNQQYKEMYGLNKKLMKYDKFLDCYLIENVWQE